MSPPMTSLPNQDSMSPNRNVLSLLVLDSAKNSNLWLLHPCPYNKAYLWRHIYVEAVHITEESEADYDNLQKKWKKHLPLGKKTGDPLEDLKQIFPETFDSQVGLFEGEVSLKFSSEAKPVQLPPCAVPQSIMPQLKKELDKMEQEGIIRACPETTEWVHNLVIVVKKDGTLRLCLDPRKCSA